VRSALFKCVSVASVQRQADAAKSPTLHIVRRAWRLSPVDGLSGLWVVFHGRICVCPGCAYGSSRFRRGVRQPRCRGTKEPISISLYFPVTSFRLPSSLSLPQLTATTNTRTRKTSRSRTWAQTGAMGHVCLFSRC